MAEGEDVVEDLWWDKISGVKLEETWYTDGLRSLRYC